MTGSLRIPIEFDDAVVRGELKTLRLQQAQMLLILTQLAVDVATLLARVPEPEVMFPTCALRIRNKE